MLLTLSAWWQLWLARVPMCGHLSIVFAESSEKYTHLRLGEWGSGLGLARNPCKVFRIVDVRHRGFVMRPVPLIEWEVRRALFRSRLLGGRLDDRHTHRRRCSGAVARELCKCTACGRIEAH